MVLIFYYGHCRVRCPKGAVAFIRRGERGVPVRDTVGIKVDGSDTSRRSSNGASRRRSAACVEGRSPAKSRLPGRATIALLWPLGEARATVFARDEPDDRMVDLLLARKMDTATPYCGLDG